MTKLSKTEYNTIHQYRLRHYKKTGICLCCEKKTKTQWANLSGEYRKNDPDDWVEFCPACHAKYDHPNSLLSKVKIAVRLNTIPLAEMPRYNNIKYGGVYLAYKRLVTYPWFRT